MSRRARFVVYQDRAGEWRWRLLAANNRIVATSGEGYTRMRDCERAIAGALRATAQVASGYEKHSSSGSSG